MLKPEVGAWLRGLTRNKLLKKTTTETMPAPSHNLGVNGSSQNDTRDLHSSLAPKSAELAETTDGVSQPNFPADESEDEG
jgi:hypothetical protein